MSVTVSLVSQAPLCHGPSHDPYSFLNFEILSIGITLNSLRLNLFLYILSFLQSCRVLCGEYFDTVLKGCALLTPSSSQKTERLTAGLLA